VHPAAGTAILVLGGVLALATGGWLRTRLPRPAIDATMALAGAAIGLGGLLLRHDVALSSWIVGPLVLAVIALLHVRALFGGEGPFRT
jgi:hypothetical protein